ncbi:F-box protein DOR-like [Papaver somniferum]|uniref:F-box protein DOR-like n=1 Tax=Papaver somniferum TaxID=3469 RepID=UPI000E700193|nr:F-box protein DOR-like [Papaver somniferum]
MAFCKILPMEITLDIFGRVPNESVLDCKLVCTSWNNLLRHPSFSRMYLYIFIHPSNFGAHSGKLGFLALTFMNDSFWYFEYNENHDQSTPPIQRITRINFTPPFTRVKYLSSCNGLIFLARYPYLEAASLCICNPSTKEHVLIPEIERDWDTNDDQYICGRDWDIDDDQYICWSHSWMLEILICNLNWFD